MIQWIQRSLLAQMVGVCLVFAIVVLGAGVALTQVVESQLRSQVQASDQALAQETALETASTVNGAVNALVNLSKHLPASTANGANLGALAETFATFRTGRNDVDHVYWLDTFGTLLLSEPADGIVTGREFEPPTVIQQVLVERRTVIEVGFAHDAGNAAAVIIAQPVYHRASTLVGILVLSLSLQELSTPLKTVVAAQHLQGYHVLIRIIDNRGELVATPLQERALDTVVNDLPGAAEALHGTPTTRQGPGPGADDWLYSAVPVPQLGWAVIVQRPANEAFAVVDSFRTWLLVVALLFAAGAVLLWLVLLRQIIQPLHLLAAVHQESPVVGANTTVRAPLLTKRRDEVGGLARSLDRMERNIALQFAELQTLLETSNSVVSSLDPRAVAETIIREVGRLVNVQAATVLVPNEAGILRVLASDGRSDHYVHTHHVSSDSLRSPAALALRDGRPVQLLAGSADTDPATRTFPEKAYAEGFRSMVAIPIISGHAGSVVLLVHRYRAQSFSESELNLLLTFANYATLAWEHAVLYDRSDERLQEVARENERLYLEAASEKQTLAAIMGSMSDGLALTDVDGCILYANPSACAMAGVEKGALEHRQIEVLYSALRGTAASPAAPTAPVMEVGASDLAAAPAEETIESVREAQRRILHLRHFAVRDQNGVLVGRGLLLRDVTREREVDEMKTTLLAAVGHELRTPLSIIKGHASTLLQDDVSWSPDEQRHSLSMISVETDRLADLVRNLLDLARIEAGLLSLHRLPHTIDELIAGALQRLGEPASKVTVDVAPDLPPVAIDRARIDVVLGNLLRNALTYGGEHVQLRAVRSEETVSISVDDDGPGVEPRDMPHLFERFYPRGGAERRAGGTGLGLAISKAFVEAHGGAIWAQSTRHGMHIEFTLPLATPETLGEESPSRQSGAVDNGLDGLNGLSERGHDHIRR